MAHKHQIIAQLSISPGLTDREITDKLQGESKGQQHTNHVVRNLEKEGIVLRTKRTDGKIGNYLTSCIDHKALMVPKTIVGEKYLENIQNEKNTFHEVIVIGGFRFSFVCPIEPVKDGQNIYEYAPHTRYKKRDLLKLHKHHADSYCQFKITEGYLSGVYAISVDNQILYIGECENLTSRYNTGYGIISPRNCFVGGQMTNCRINRLILEAVKNKRKVSLWFHPSSRHKYVEAKLLSDLQDLSWNLKGQKSKSKFLLQEQLCDKMFI